MAMLSRKHDLPNCCASNLLTHMSSIAIDCPWRIWGTSFCCVDASQHHCLDQKTWSLLSPTKHLFHTAGSLKYACQLLLQPQMKTVFPGKEGSTVSHVPFHCSKLAVLPVYELLAWWLVVCSSSYLFCPLKDLLLVFRKTLVKHEGRCSVRTPWDW